MPEAGCRKRDAGSGMPEAGCGEAGCRKRDAAKRDAAKRVQKGPAQAADKANIRMSRSVRFLYSPYTRTISLKAS